MTRHRERYHQAARDNYVDLLREATRSECDAADESGMSPVMWAAFYGHLESLRVLIGRGGDPDRTDHMGSSALHFAALNGHMNCVTYLVNFGANIWSLDTDYRSALDLAVLRDHSEIADFLDGVAGRQSALNKRTVAKRRERAALDAQRRVKKLEKLMKKADKRLAKEDSAARAVSTTKTVDGLHPVTNPNYHHSPLSGTAAAAAAAAGGSHVGVASSPPGVVLERTNESARAYSDYVGSSSASTVGRLPRTSADVLYARTGADGRSIGSAEVAAEARTLPGLLERPGFGNVAFLQPPGQQPLPPQQLLLQPPHSPRSSRSLSPLPSPTRTLGGESVGTAASLSLRPWREMPWIEPDVDTLAPDYDMDDLDGIIGDGSGGEPTDLETFLACLGLTDFLQQLSGERFDLYALTLCSDADLQGLGLPLGPRRRLLEALERRRVALETRRSMQDLRF